MTRNVRHLRVKLEALQHYSGTDPAMCACCGITEIKLLTIDHIDGGVPEGKKKGGAQLYYWLWRNGFPNGYRVLCVNCNWAIGVYGSCPHGTLIIQETDHLPKIRLGWGRPRPDAGELTSTNFLVDVQDFERFRQVCRERRISMSAAIRQLMREELSKT